MLLREFVWDVENWLDNESGAVRMASMMFACVIVMLIMQITVNAFYHAADIHPANAGSINVNDVVEGSIRPSLILLVVVLEELFFRLLPLGIVTRLFVNNLKILGIVSVVSSVVFGLVHGDYLNIPIQGMDGFIHCVLFLKCG